jgi:hypothetical protein
MENRAFMQRAVRFLAGEAGIRQFIDIGTGIPAAGNVHEVAGQVAPDARVVYVDNDPIVHVHANALLTGGGSTSVVLADLRDPEAILADPGLRSMIDLSQPVALLLMAILHFITDQETPAAIVATLRDALPGVILSFRVSRGCDLVHRVADSVVDAMAAGLPGCFQGAGLLPDRVRDERWSPRARASWRRSRAFSSVSCWLRWRVAASLARSDSLVARWLAGMALAGVRLWALPRSLRTWSLMSGWV